MAINAQKRETKDFGKKVGVFNADVIAINPDREELETIYGGAEIEKDPEYVSEKQVKVGDEGDEITVDAARIVVFLKDKDTKAILQATFYLENRDRENKDGTKKQYINNVGTTSWAADENSLPAWFKESEGVRVAKVGEEELYTFAKAWASGIDFKKTTEFSFDFDKLIQGNAKELKALMNTDLIGSVAGLATIRTVEKDGEQKEYQGVYNRKFLSGYSAKFFKAGINSAQIEGWKANLADKDKKKSVKGYQRFAVEVSDSEYGVKDFYKLEGLKDYDPAENVVSGDDVLSGDPDDTSY